MEQGNAAQSQKEAELVADLMRHPGMTIIRKQIAEKRVELYKRWWRGSPEEAEKARQQARHEEAFFNHVKEILVKGKAAEQRLHPPTNGDEPRVQGE